YQLVVQKPDRAAVTSQPVDPFKSKAIVTDDDPQKQVRYEHPSFEGDANYSLAVTAYVNQPNGSVAEVTKTSDPIFRDNPPHVYALVVGVSQYSPDNGVVGNLRHADSDAELVGDVLRAVLLPNPAAIVDVRASRDSTARVKSDELASDMI